MSLCDGVNKIILSGILDFDSTNQYTFCLFGSLDCKEKASIPLVLESFFCGCGKQEYYLFSVYVPQICKGWHTYQVKDENGNKVKEGSIYVNKQ